MSKELTQEEFVEALLPAEFSLVVLDREFWFLPHRTWQRCGNYVCKGVERQPDGESRETWIRVPQVGPGELGQIASGGLFPPRELLVYGLVGMDVGTSEFGRLRITGDGWAHRCDGLQFVFQMGALKQFFARLIRVRTTRPV